MFGGPLERPRKIKPQESKARILDINLTGPDPYVFGHFARVPNTNYAVKLLHYKQRLRETLEKISQKLKRTSIREHIILLYEPHFQKLDLKKEIKKRAEQKLRDADAAVQKRREKLLELLAQEERQYFYETVEHAQKGKENKLAEMKAKADKYKAKREAERLKIVEEKRYLQYKEQNELLRVALEKLHNIEAKMINIQQMRENESKREAEREIDMFYHKVMMKDIEEKKKREEQDAILQGNDMRELHDTWTKQIRGKELLKKEIEQVQKEDYEAIQQNLEKLEQESLEEKKKACEEKIRRQADLKAQMESRQKFLDQRQKESEALNNAFARMNELEYEKEKQADADTRMQERREMMAYKRYCHELRLDREEEDRKIMEILEADQREIIRKQDEEKCRIKAEKKKLTDEIFASRAQQIEDRKRVAAEMKEENHKIAEFMKKAMEIDACLTKEDERLQREKRIQYRDDLCRQIAYNKLIKEREMNELKREEELCKMEEERYLDILNRMIQGKIESGSKHPFREILEEFECYCNEYENKMRNENTLNECQTQNAAIM